MDELYLDNIDEFVNDHNKIVTYKWLSLTLGVHVNIAKQMLYHYLDHKRKESSAQLHATYLVTGKFVENGNTSHKVSVVREEQLEDVKSKMSLTVSVHVYSVQKAVLKDSSPLYNVDYDAVKDNPKSCSRYSAIKCAEAVPSSSEEVQRAREAPCVPAPEPPNNKASANGHGSLASKPAAKPPKGIMGMFSSKAAPKNQESKEIKLETKEDVAEGEVTKSKPAKKTNPMSNFFGSQATKRRERTVKDEGVTSSSSVEAIPSEKTEETVKEEMPKETKQDTRSKTKRKEESDSEEEVKEKKKRRRIKKPQPDSSDDDDEVIPDSPRQQEVRKPPPAPDRLLKEMSVPQPNECTRRKRRRVMKSRTFMDEEGCIVTEKGFESESYSESEDNTQSRKSPSLASKVPSLPSKVATTKKEDEKKGKKKTAAAANKGAKQPSIMGFFQKK